MSLRSSDEIVDVLTGSGDLIVTWSLHFDQFADVCNSLHLLKKKKAFLMRSESNIYLVGMVLGPGMWGQMGGLLFLILMEQL